MVELSRNRVPCHPAEVIKLSDTGDAAALAARLTRFKARYNATVRRFGWKFTPRRAERPVPPHRRAPQPRQRLAGRLTGAILD